MDNIISLIGPSSIVRFKNIEIEDYTVNVLLFGDFHNSLDFSKLCCDDVEIINARLFQFYQTQMFIHSHTAFLQDLRELLYFFENEQNEVINIDNFKKILHDFNVDENRVLINKNITQKYLEYESVNVLDIEIKNFIKSDIKNISYQIKLSLANLKNSIINSNNEKVKNKCMILYEYLFEITNKNNECIDFFIENSNHDDKNNEYKLMPYENMGYLDISEWFFTSIMYLKHIEKKENLDISINMYSNIRFHNSNIRLYTLSPDISDIARNNIYEINKKYIFNNDDVFIMIDEYLKYIRNFISGTTFESKYKKLYDEYDENTKILLMNQMNKLKKQFEKSIFCLNSEYFFNTFGSLLYHIINEIIDIMNPEEEKEKTLWFIETLNMNLYTIFRMFVKKNSWSTQRLDENNACSKLSYPKNIIIHQGEAHITFIKLFIMGYFKIYPSCNLPENRHYLDSLSDVINEEDLEQNLRCLKVKKEDLYF